MFKSKSVFVKKQLFPHIFQKSLFSSLYWKQFLQKTRAYALQDPLFLCYTKLYLYTHKKEVTGECRNSCRKIAPWST